MFAIIITAQNPWNSEIYTYSRAYDMSSFGLLSKYFKKKVFKNTCKKTLLNLGLGKEYFINKYEDFNVYVQMSTEHNLGCFVFSKKTFPKDNAMGCAMVGLRNFEEKNGKVFHWYKEDKNLTSNFLSILTKYNTLHNNMIDLVRLKQKGFHRKNAINAPDFQFRLDTSKSELSISKSKKHSTDYFGI